MGLDLAKELAHACWLLAVKTRARCLYDTESLEQVEHPNTNKRIPQVAARPEKKQ